MCIYTFRSGLVDYLVVWQEQRWYRMSKPEIVEKLRTQGVISMGFSVSGLRQPGKTAGSALFISLLAAVSVILLFSTALAGTESGEFCPDCPDWTNLDGWYAQKESYENSIQSPGTPVQQNTGNSPAQGVAAANPIEEKADYPEASILTRANSIESDRVVLDVRSAQDYQEGHIAGARNLYWRDLQRDGALDPSLAQDALGRAGINSSDRLLIYGDSDDEGAPFVFWALSYLGQEDVSLLDGGIDAALSAGLALSANAPSPAPSNYTSHIVPWLLVTPEGLDGMLGRSDVSILDARDFSEYGKDRITNEAIPLSLDKIYKDSEIKDAGTLKDLFGRRLDDSGTAIVYGTPEAYSLFFSLRLMGYNASLLEGDWWKETGWAVSNVT